MVDPGFLVITSYDGQIEYIRTEVRSGPSLGKNVLVPIFFLTFFIFRASE